MTKPRIGLTPDQKCVKQVVNGCAGGTGLLLLEMGCKEELCERMTMSEFIVSDYLVSRD